MSDNAEYWRNRAGLLEAAIRKHRDQRGDDRCLEDDYELYATLPEGFKKPEFCDPFVMMGQCVKFIQHRVVPGMEYVSPQRRIDELEDELSKLRRLEKVLRECGYRGEILSELVEDAIDFGTEMRLRAEYWEELAGRGTKDGELS